MDIILEEDIAYKTKVNDFGVEPVNKRIISKLTILSVKKSLTDLSVISLTVVSFNLSCNIPILFFTFERFTFIVIFLTTGKPHQNLSKAIFQINF